MASSTSAASKLAESGSQPSGSGTASAPTDGSDSYSSALAELHCKCQALERREKEVTAWLLGCVLVTVLAQTPLWQSWIHSAWTSGRKAFWHLFQNLVVRPAHALSRFSFPRWGPQAAEEMQQEENQGQIVEAGLPADVPAQVQAANAAMAYAALAAVQQRVAAAQEAAVENEQLDAGHQRVVLIQRPAVQPRRIAPMQNDAEGSPKTPAEQTFMPEALQAGPSSLLSRARIHDENIAALRGNNLLKFPWEPSVTVPTNVLNPWLEQSPGPNAQRAAVFLNAHSSPNFTPNAAHGPTFTEIHQIAMQLQLPVPFNNEALADPALEAQDAGLASEVMSEASWRTDNDNEIGLEGFGNASGDGKGDSAEINVTAEDDLEFEAEEDDGCSILGLPPCVGANLLKYLDADGIRTLRLVCRSLYFEASRYVQALVVTPANLATLLAQPVHTIMPQLRALIFRCEPPEGAGLLPSSTPGPQPPMGTNVAAAGALNGFDALVSPGRARGSFTASRVETTMLIQFLHQVLPCLKDLEVIDLSEAPLHTNATVWAALLESLPGPSTRIVLRENSAWAYGAMGLLSTPEALRDATDYYVEMHEALKKAHKHCSAVMSSGARTGGTPRPMPLQIDLLGVTVRRSTANRLPQLCSMQFLTSLTLFGKSASAAQHGHRLASHLAAVSNLRNLRRLELLSYEDVSDAELAPLAACPKLAHLYLDSLFIKQAVGPVFPSITSLTAARVKFILRPLTSIFPALAQLRLGVLHSELNKKISSASLSCLAGCDQQLKQLCVCPVLWKGQWQVLPTVPGLTTLQLVHCKDLFHLREVLLVVGRSSSLERLELHGVSPTIPPWPGASGDNDVANVVVDQAAAIAGAAAIAAGVGPGVGDVAAMVAAAAGNGMQDDTDASGSVLETNIYAGLAGNSKIHTLVVCQSSGRLVRHLVAADMPALTRLEFRNMGSALKLSDLQAAILALPALHTLVIEGGSDFDSATAMHLPTLLNRPGLNVEWRSTCSLASVLFARDCGNEPLLQPLGQPRV